MAAPVTFKWLANFTVSDSTNFRDRFYTAYDDEKISSYQELQRQKMVVQLLNHLSTLIDNKLIQLLTLYFYAINSEVSFSESYWRNILVNDLKIKEECVDTILQLLFTNYWTQDTVNQIAETISSCIQQDTNRSLLLIFPTLLQMNITPTDFPIENFKDFLSSWISFVSYTVNACYVPINAYLDDVLQTEFDVSDSWNTLIKNLMIQKLKDNLFDETLLTKYLYVSYLPKLRQYLLDWYYSTANDVKAFKAVTYAIFKTLHDFAKDLSDTDANIKDFIESYDFKTKLQQYFDEIKELIKFQLYRFDKTKINNYITDVLNKSDDIDHLHPGLFPIWQYLCESVDFSYNDMFCFLYNALESIHYLSNYHTVDVNDYVSDKQDTNYTFDLLDELAQQIKQQLLSYTPDVSQYQISDWFYEAYVSVSSIITSSLSDAYQVLLQPLFDELSQKYNVTYIEDLKSIISSRVFLALKSYQDSQFNNLVSIMQQIRSHANFDQAIDDFQNSNCKTLTSLLKEIFASFLSQYRNFLSFTDIKDQIKQIIIDEVSRYSSDSQLLFDTLAQNLDFLINYDTYFGYFENAFINKLRYDLEKFKQQMEHTLIGVVYMNIFKLDSLTYSVFVDKYYKDHMIMLKKLEFVLIASIYADRMRYESTDITEFTLHLKTPYNVIKTLESSIPLTLIQQIVGS